MSGKHVTAAPLVIYLLFLLMVILCNSVFASGVSLNMYVRLMNSTREEYYEAMEARKKKEDSEYQERLEVFLRSLGELNDSK